MEERSRSIVDIKRAASPADIVVASVLITDGSMRIFSLMQSDYVQLNFSLDAAVYFEIGDYIDDEIFGRFVVTEHQMPNYNTATGGYDYTLKLEALYYLWKNKVFMLTALDSQDNRVRKETNWCLTDKLSVHLDEVIHNLTILGYTGYTYQIEATAEHASEVRFIEYKDKDIISSLTAMANEWECEWWVRDKVIHFGKCEGSGSVMDFELGVTVESMTIQKNVNKYLNKIFAFGSTQNIPSNYRKKLIFDVKDITTQDGMTLYGDTARPITEAMLINSDSGSIIREHEQLFPSPVIDTASGVAYDDTAQFTLTEDGIIDGDLNLEAETDIAARWECSITCELVNSLGRVVATLGSDISRGYGHHIEAALPLRTDAEGGSYTVHTRVEINISGSQGANIDYISPDGTIWFKSGGVSKWCNLYLESDTEMQTPYKVYFNPLHQVHTQDYYGYFMFDSSAPTGFALGSKFILDPISYADVPASYYSQEYDDPSALAKLGEARLMLPESTGGYLITDPNLTRDQIVESVVTFNNIYPHAIQKVTHVGSEEKESKEEQQDGSTTIWAWTQYILTATLADGNLFPFSKRYITDGMTLQIKFITKEDLEAAGYTETAGAEYRLAGMTFDVSFDDLAQTYTLVRNEDYGAKLPNDILKPTVGDPFVLINWNVKVMEQLGLIDIAEQALENIAQDYLDAIEQGQFTFTCMLMSDVFFDLADRAAYYNIGIPFHTSNNEQLYVRMPSGGYILPIEGQPVRVIHGALSEPKISRVIGYQFKLDKPYDTPQYTIGETQAYSRLAQIEKEINKLQ